VIVRGACPQGKSVTEDIDNVLAKLDWMRERRIWPNGMRYLWTDAFGVVLLVSLYHRLKQPKFLAQAQLVVAEVERVLGIASFAILIPALFAEGAFCEMFGSSSRAEALLRSDSRHAMAKN
jgi:hypothetical protein